MSSATALLADAETSIKAGEWDQALEQLENLKKDQPNQPEVYERLAHVLAVRGKFQSVITTYLELIKVLVEAENLEHATRAVDKVLELRPESGEARERRIEIENKRGNTARAVYLSRELARLCIDQGDGERSIRLLQDALKHEPGNLDIALELAEMFVSHGHIQDGANQYRKVANAFQEAGNIAKAAEAYRRMKVVQSDDPEVLLTLGRLYTQLGKLDEAEQEFRSVLRHDLDHEQALLELGLVCQLKGRFRSGILAFNKVLQNNPGLVAAKRKLGELHHSQGMMTEAVDFFLQAAQGHLEADEKEDAVECFQIVLSVDENNAPAQQGLTNLGAPVQPRAFEPPQPPTPPAEEPAAPEAPPPPVPFDTPTTSLALDPVGGVPSERTERLPAMNFEPPSEGEPPKPEAKPHRPLSSGLTGGLAAGAAGARRLGGGGNIKRGLVDPRAEKPMMQSGERPMLGRSGGIRRGLSQKDLGLGGPSPDKPLLGQAGPGDRRPTMRLGEPAGQPAAPSPSPRVPSFADQAPLEDFTKDMALDDVFAEPAASPGPPPELDDFDVPGAGSFFDEPASGAEASGGGDLFDDKLGDDLFAPSEDPFDAPAAAPTIGSFSVSSDDDGGNSAPSSLRPGYAQEAPDFGEELGDDLFDFDGHPSQQPESSAPTLARGGLFDDNAGEDLFGESAGTDDLFNAGADLFDEPQGEAPQISSARLAAPAGLFEDEEAGVGEQGLFEGDSDPFANIFDEGPVEQESAAETIGGSFGGGRPTSPAPGELFFDDESASQQSDDSAFGGGFFDEPAEEPRSIAISVGESDDLFGGGGEDLFGDPEPPMAATPTIRKEPDDGLFGGDSASDLFGDDDMFATSDSEALPSHGSLDEGFSSGGETGLFEAGSDSAGDLFSGPDDGGFGSPAVSLDAPLGDGQELGSDGLFGDDSSSGLFESSDDGLFGGPDDVSGDIFGGEPLGTESGMFGGPSDFGGDDYGSNGAAGVDGSTLFEPELSGVDSASGDGLFEGIGSEDDSLFGGFEQPADDFAPEQAEQSFFGEVDPGESSLFGGDDGGLFGGDTEEPSLSAQGGDVFGASGGDDLFGDFGAEQERDDIRLPLSNEVTSHETSQDLFGGPSDDGADLFGSPSDAAQAADPVVQALQFEEPAPISIPDPVEPMAEAFGGGGDLFGDAEQDGLFGSAELDEPPPPLGLELPMPDDPPLASDWGEQASTPVSDANDADEDLFGGGSGSGDDLFGGSDFEAPLSFEIPEPSDELDRDVAGGHFEPVATEPSPSEESELTFDLEPAAGETILDFNSGPLTSELDPGGPGEVLSFGGSGDLFSPESESAFAMENAAVAVQTPEPEPEPEEAPEFMAMLELTMPKLEEATSVEAEPEPIAIPEPVSASAESFDSALRVEENLFEASFEPVTPGPEETVPQFEEPSAPEPDPADLLSPEQKAEIAQTLQADALEESLAGADVASKIASYRKVLEENPDNLVLRTRLADIHLKFGLLEDAVVQYRQVLRRNPESIPLLHKVIQAEFWNENYVEAGDSLLALAKLHLKAGEHHEALDTLQSVLSLDPLHFEARQELVSVFTSLNESKLAAHHLRQLAETALTKGEVAGAITAFEQLLEISADPTFEERLAQIYESQGDVAKALASFRSLVGRYTSEERWEEAARVTERIVELAPQQLEDRESLIGLYQRLGHAQSAVEQQFHLARSYQEKNELDRSIALFEEVLKFQGENQEARRHLVDAYLDAGRVPAALEQAEALTEHYLDTRDHATAITLYARLVEADEENVELQERLVKFYGLAGDSENARARWIELSYLHERHGRFDRAAEAIQKALELEEGQVELQHRLALLYAERLNDAQGALMQFRKLFQLAPDRTDAVKMYIDLLLKGEQVGEAGQVLKTLEQAGGESVEIKSSVIASLRASVEGNPADLKARFNYGELCYHLGDLDHAIEQFQQTRKHPDYELKSYNMLGLCFASKRGYMMLDLAVNQFKKGLETKGQPEQDYLEIRYNLAMVQYQNGRAAEALANLKECYNVDIAYKDVRTWIQKIEGELNTGS